MRYFNQAYAIVLLFSIVFFLALQFFIIGDVCLKGDEERLEEVCGIGLEDFMKEQERCPEGIRVFQRTALCAQALVSYMTETTVMIAAFNLVYAPAYFLYLRKR